MIGLSYPQRTVFNALDVISTKIINKISASTPSCLSLFSANLFFFVHFTVILLFGKTRCSKLVSSVFSFHFQQSNYLYFYAQFSSFNYLLPRKLYIYIYFQPCSQLYFQQVDKFQQPKSNCFVFQQLLVLYLYISVSKNNYPINFFMSI